MTGLDTFIRHPLPLVIVPDDQRADRSQTRASFGRGGVGHGGVTHRATCRRWGWAPASGPGTPGGCHQAPWASLSPATWEGALGARGPGRLSGPQGATEKDSEGKPPAGPTLPSWGEKMWVYDMGLPMPPEVWPGDSVALTPHTVGPGHGALTLTSGMACSLHVTASTHARPAHPPQTRSPMLLGAV